MLTFIVTFLIWLFLGVLGISLIYFLFLLVRILRTNHRFQFRYAYRVRPNQGYVLMTVAGLIVLSLIITFKSPPSQFSHFDSQKSRSGSSVNLMAANQLKPLIEIKVYALHLVNQDRQEHGLNPLIPDPILDKAALAHAEDMLRRNYFDHISPEGQTPLDRYLKAGGNINIGVGENIFYYQNSYITGLSYETTKFFEQEWMKSPGHRENILNPSFTSFGYGVVYGSGAKQYAVQMFATSP